MHQPSPTALTSIVDVKDIRHFTQQIFKYTEKLCNAYEHIMTRYEQISLENVQLKSASAMTSLDPLLVPANLSHKRRKTDESVINDSVASNDPLNEAIQDISSCQEDCVIESTPKVDMTRKNVMKKVLTFRSPNKRIEIKEEKLNDSKDSKDGLLLDAKDIKVERSPTSPLRSVQNQSNLGKENRPKPPGKWLSNVLTSPSRVTRSGFITAKSPKGVSRLSLSKPFKQSLLDFAKKPVKETTVDSCAETFFDGTPRNPVPDVKSKFLRQQRLEACVNTSRDSDDENVFSFKSDAKSINKSSTSPPNIKLEPLTGQPKTTGKATTDNNPLPSGSGGSSVVALSGQQAEVIVIQESQPLFEDCSETYCERLDLKLQAVETLAGKLKISDDEKSIANHRLSCRRCEVFMDSNPRLKLSEKLKMVDTCIQRYPVREDTDPEFWNPRFVPTPESQKQETLIDDRWSRRKKS
ncbi:uncharacterized protein LOC119070689 [Bradysia coprophila]|uniref:uncharacterized protein LOC119070689 n=1 Tax=Bradysia coprophila TaxID=38358 RepID=UPI00187D740B|nr:uncharacterized protein LOC119070689 [Bradysia coprophila]